MAGSSSTARSPGNDNQFACHQIPIAVPNGFVRLHVSPWLLRFARELRRRSRSRGHRVRFLRRSAAMNNTRMSGPVSSRSRAGS